MLKSLKQDYKVDEKRIFSTGHSNGGGFTYLLWSERPDVFNSQKFSPGCVAVTANAAQNLSDEEVTTALRRHLRGDWGELDPYDRQENERALREGGQLLSVYRNSKGLRFYVLTEADRSGTTLLLPEDY